MGKATVAMTRSEDLFMAGSICFSKIECETAVALKSLIVAKADKLRDDFIEKTIAEIEQRGWAKVTE